MAGALPYLAWSALLRAASDGTSLRPTGLFGGRQQCDNNDSSPGLLPGIPRLGRIDIGQNLGHLRLILLVELHLDF
jgi:hypothetical protein